MKYSERERQTAYDLIYMQNKTTELIDTEKILAVARGGVWEWQKWVKDQKVKTCSYEMNVMK